MPRKLTDHDLLVRIDERQKNMSKKINSLCKKLKLKVDDDEEYQEVKTEAKDWRDTKNKIRGWLIGVALGGGATGGAVSLIISNLVKGVLAK